jgi:hypothetical protein
LSSLSESTNSTEGIKRTFKDHLGFKDNKTVLE